MRRLSLFGLVLALATGCWARLEREQLSRLDTMDGHLLAAFDAVNAVQARDQARFDGALQGLEHGGSMPGADVDAQLKLFHRTAKDLRKATDWPARAEGTTRLLEQCGACHTAHQVRADGLWEPENTVENGAWALVWRSDVHWRATQLSGASWEARREAFQAKLLE